MRKECLNAKALSHEQLFDRSLHPPHTQRRLEEEFATHISFWNLCPESPSSARESNGRVGLEGGRRPLGRPRGAAARFTMDATCCGRDSRLLSLLLQENFHHPAHFA